MHTCALLDTGAVRCWGFAGDGELGYGNVNNFGDSETPSSAGDVFLGAAALEVTAGSAHTCALLVNDEVRCWGFGANGRLGYGNAISIGDNELPFGVVGLFGVATQLIAGGSHTCALLDTGAVQCFGANGTGQLGYANKIAIGDDELPTDLDHVLVF